MKTPNSTYEWDWPLAGLMVVLVYTAAARLSITDWTPDLWTVESLSVLGTVLGLLMGISKFRKAAKGWLLTGYSFVSIPWILTELISGEKTAIGRLASLGGRLEAALELVFQGKAVSEPLFFVTSMCILFWLIGVYSGYQTLNRPQILTTLLPSVIPLLVVQYYDGYHTQRLWMVGFYFFIAILVIGRLNLLNNREHWKQRRVFTGTDPEFDIGRGLAIVAALIIMAAWSLPAPAAAIPAIARVWQDFNKPFENTRKRLDDVLAALSGGRSIVAGELYGKTMGLGQSAGQGDAEIFIVKPAEFLPVRNYWRVRVYDVYENGRWTTSSSDNINFSSASDDPIDPGILNDQTTEFVFNWRTNRISMMVTPAYPLWASRTGSYQVNPLSKDSLDLLSWSVNPPIERGDRYTVRAMLSNPTIKDLRAAGENYPDWVKDHYLILPANLSNNIRNISGRLTAGKDTPYDEAIAITDYLRNEIKYSLTIPSPPPGIDPVDWFLFTWKSGFCNYYASAEVLLLRAAGIPSRLVVGYAPGEHQSNGSYKISARDAHAWPEIYFPSIGWVEFEPTASQDPIYRPSGDNTPTGADDAFPSIQERFGRPDGSDEALRNAGRNTPDNGTLGTNSNIFSRQSAWLWVIIFIMLVISVAGLVWRTKRQLSFIQKLPQAIRKLYVRYNFSVPSWLEHWVRWSEVTAVERAFHAINQSLGWMGKAQAQNITAFERALALKELIPDAAAEIDSLAAAHEKTLYTTEQADTTAATRAAWIIRYRTLRTIVHRWLYGE